MQQTSNKLILPENYKRRSLSLSDLDYNKNNKVKSSITETSEWKKIYPKIKIIEEENCQTGRTISVGTMREMGIYEGQAVYMSDEDLIPIRRTISVKSCVLDIQDFPLEKREEYKLKHPDVFCYNNSNSILPLG